MNKQELIMARIRNQLRIHWMWLKKEKDYKVVADYIQAWMKQASNDERFNKTIAKCVICGKPFQKRGRPVNNPTGSRSKGMRPSNAITCSKRCSLEHGLVRQRGKKKKKENTK